MAKVLKCKAKEHIPPGAGTYAVFYELPLGRELQIGKRGNAFFPAGKYVYFGNALGPGGLSARIAHHLRLSVKPHWHIDWFRKAARPLGVLFAESETGFECAWRKRVSESLQAEVVLEGFGASDCRNGCRSHLLFLPANTGPAEVGACLAARDREGRDLYLLDLLGSE